MNVLRKAKFPEVPRAKRIDRSGDLRRITLNHRPTCRGQNQNGEVPRAQVLLTAQALVSGDERIERRFGTAEKVAILKLCPARFVGRGNGVARQRVAQGRGRSLVEENLHQLRRRLLAPSGGDQALLG